MTGAPWSAGTTRGSDGALAVAGVDLRTLAAQHGTPVYVLDEADFRARARAYLGAFTAAFAAIGTGVDVYYAGKAFLSVAVARWAHEEGLRVDRLVARHADARAVVVTPAHQAPLGVSMTLARRMKLLAWAAANGAWVVEDDYDSEFRYVGAPLPALKSADGAGRVLYAGTFSKVLHPGLGLAYLVVPTSQVDAFTQQVVRTGNGCAHLQQEIVADFMELGHFPRHIRRMRGLYAKRRRWLVEALHAAFGRGVQVDLQAGGMHLLARFPGHGADDALAERAQARGLAVQALSRRSSGTHAGQGLLMGLTNVVSREDAAALAGKLRAAMGR